MAKKKAAMPIEATYFRDYDAKKFQSQKYEDNERCSEYIEWYRSSWQAKDDREIFTLWKTLDEYWEGNSNKRQYIDDPASNTNIVHPMIEGQVALMADENWEVMPEAQTPSEIEYIPSVKYMLDFVFQNNRTFQVLDMTARRILKYGTGIINVQFDPAWGDGFGLPIIRSCNPTYVYPDPNIVDVYHIQEGRFLIETITKSISWAERQFGKEKAEMIVPGYDPISQSTYYDEDSYNTSEIQRMHYIHMLIWEKYQDEKGRMKLRLTQMSGDGTLLYDSEQEGHEFCDCRFPYFFVPCYYREGSVWSKGDAELLMDQQDQINDIDDQILNNARLTGNPQKVFDPSMVPDGEMWSNEHGLILPATGGPSSVGYLIPPPMPQYIIAKRNQIMMSDAPSITRFYPQMTGGRVKGVDTATEALAMQQSGMTGVDHKKKILAAVLSEVAEYIFTMCMFYWDEEKYFMLTGKKDFLVFDPSKMAQIPEKEPSSYKYVKEFMERNPDKPAPQVQYKTDAKGKVKKKKAQIKFNFRMGTGTPKNPAFLYSVWKEDYAMKVCTLEEYRKFQKEYLGMPFDLERPEGTLIDDDMQGQTNNITGLNTALNQNAPPKTAQGRRTDKEMSATPNVSVSGLNANNAVQTSGGRLE